MGILVWTAIRVGIVLLLLAILDYAFQKWQMNQDLRMTKHELKEELKRMEGDPIICYDNIERPFGGPTICAILTQGEYKDRNGDEKASPPAFYLSHPPL